MAMEDFNEEQFTKKVFKLKKDVSDINSDDNLIQILGTAKNVNPSMEFKITDETGSFSVREIPTTIDKIEEGKLYRVFGEVSMDASGTQFIIAQVVQPMEGLDVKIYKKSLDLYNNIK